MEQEIKDFFDRYVFGWMYSDVEICEKHGANFGGVALICAYIDFMGKLYLGIEGDGQIRERFVGFIDDFFDNKYKRFSKFIYSDYRCGLLHQFFPRKGAGITRGEENREYHLVIDKENSLIPVNLTVFFEDFKKAVDVYFKKLTEDEQLQKNFSKVYQSMSNEMSEHFRELLTSKNKVVMGPNSVWSLTTSTIVSGVLAVSSVGVGILLKNPDSYTSRMPSEPSTNEKKQKEIINETNF